MRGFAVVNDRNGVAQARDNFLNGGEDEVGVIAEIEFPTPGVEELNRGDAGVDLGLEVGNGGLGDAREQLAENFGLVVEETFDRGEAFFGAALDHVAGEGPGGGGETQNGNVGADEFNGATEGFHEEASFFLRIKNVEFFYIAFGANGMGEIGTGILQFKSKAHGFGGDEDVGENNDGVDAESAEGLKGNFDSQVGSLANLQERVLSSDFAVLGEVSASLAHHPNREARHRFAAAGAQKQLFTGNTRVLTAHRYMRQDNKSSVLLSEKCITVQQGGVSYTGGISINAQTGGALPQRPDPRENR